MAVLGYNLKHFNIGIGTLAGTGNRAVYSDPNGYKSLDYVKFSAFLLEAVKAQQGQIEQLKQRLERLEKGS